MNQMMTARMNDTEMIHWIYMHASTRMRMHATLNVFNFLTEIESLKLGPMSAPDDAR
jgi:hypothetical protein